MNATENRLKFEMEDAQRNLNWVNRELETTHTPKWEALMHEYRQAQYRNYYRAKHELKTLKANLHAE